MAAALAIDCAPPACLTGLCMGGIKPEKGLLGWAGCGIKPEKASGVPGLFLKLPGPFCGGHDGSHHR